MRLVSIVPQLGDDEEVLSLDDSFGEELVESSTYFVLVLVDLGFVNVSVTGLDGVNDSLLDLTWLTEPRTETNGWDRVAVVEFVGLQSKECVPEDRRRVSKYSSELVDANATAKWSSTTEHRSRAHGSNSDYYSPFRKTSWVLTCSKGSC